MSTASPSSDDRPPGALPPEPFTADPPDGHVGRAVMAQRWDSLTFVHWSFPPDVVQAHLPDGLRVDTIDGRAWVGLVPFHMQRIRVPGTPAIPWLGTFPETNIRTYAVDPDGARTVWFSSLDITRGIPVAVARIAFGLPYMRSKMSLERDGDEVTYRCARAWPHRDRPESVVRVRIGAQVAAEDESPLERFLTARWGLSTVAAGRLRHGAVDHDRWTLHRAELLELDDGLLAAAGYPEPEGEPLVHWTPGVDTRIGWLRTAGRRAAAG